MAIVCLQDVLTANGCDIEAAKTHEWMALKTFVRRLPRDQWSTLWRDLLTDPLLRATYSNFRHIVEIVLVIPMATASVERGFSTMKRVKTDWRSCLDIPMLRMLMWISIHGPSLAAYHATTAVHTWWDSAERTRRVAALDAERR